MESSHSKHAFSKAEREAVYRAIYERRDIRSEFLHQPIPEEILMRILNAAHHAGSVGFMQPWNFIIINQHAIKCQVKELFIVENAKAAKNYTGDRLLKYQSFKLEGIEEAPINICVTCDPTRGGFVLGRNSIPETDLYSTCCAIQNMWLAARAEGIGMGWVSIMDNRRLRDILSIPNHVTPIAYLCLGYVSSFPEKPMLEQKGWENRTPIEELIFWNCWHNSLHAVQ